MQKKTNNASKHSNSSLSSQYFFRKYSFKAINKALFCGERKRKRSIGLQYSRLEDKDINKIYQNRWREAEYHKEYTQAPNL